MADLPNELTQKKTVNADYINRVYDANLDSQKATLDQNYAQNLYNADAQQDSIRRQTDQNLNRTYVEAQKAARNWSEVQNAYGLTSGSQAQARLAQGNQLRDDLTNLRTVQANAEADIEKQRTLYGQQYSSALAKAQADNDIARAQALYKDAKDTEDQLRAQQEAIAKLFAQNGDYSYLGQLYGLTADQIAALTPKASGGYEYEPRYYGSKKKSPQETLYGTITPMGETEWKQAVSAMVRNGNVDPDGTDGNLLRTGTYANYLKAVNEHNEKETEEAA